MPDDEQHKSDPSPDEAAVAPKDDSPEQPPEGGESTSAAVEDKFRPEAIAERVASMGEETDVDRIAREEEQKLNLRKKGKKGKKGLEAAASKRLAKIGEMKVKRPSAASDSSSSDADPLLERTARLTEWIKEHRQTFGAVVAVALLGVGGALGYMYWQGKHEADASAVLAQAFADEHGHVSDKDDDDDDEAKARQLYPTFKTIDARRDAAIAKYKEVESKFAGTGAAILARLSEAGLLLDKGDAKGATAAYEEVKSSPLAQADAEVRGRALEGIGFADELLAQSDAAGKDGHLDAALAAFKQLEQVDMKGFKELGQYHEARVLQAKGDKAKAIELLKDVQKRVGEPGAEHPFSYLEYVVEDRLRALDPTALPPKPKGTRGMGGPGGGQGGPGDVDMSDPQIQELLRQLQQQQQQGGQGGGGGPQVPAPPPGGPK
ncbi:MAG TPA: hypothetical protein VGL81_26525 [Polyangiaceae bacterium]